MNTRSNIAPFEEAKTALLPWKDALVRPIKAEGSAAKICDPIYLCHTLSCEVLTLGIFHFLELIYFTKMYRISLRWWLQRGKWIEGNVFISRLASVLSKPQYDQLDRPAQENHMVLWRTRAFGSQK